MMKHMAFTTNTPTPKTLCSSEYAKLISAEDGMFPDFGHHSEGEMGGLWMHPIKLLDGFWLRFKDESTENVDTWILADRCTCTPGEVTFDYLNGLGHTNVTIHRSHLAPESAPGVVVTYTFVNHAEEARETEIEFLARTDLYPAWFCLDSGFCEYGEDHGAWNEETSTFTARDDKNPWCVAVHCGEKPDKIRMGQFFGPQVTRGKGVSFSATYHVTLQPQEEKTLTFYMTGSEESEEKMNARMVALLSPMDFRKEKETHYEALLCQSELDVHDDHFNTVWDWTKVNTDWLTVKSGKYGRGLTAGMPEYPWWFGCDSCYAIQGLLAIGQYELARETLKLLADYSEKVNGNGRIVHEINTYGICSNPGNTQETAHYVTALWHYWQWTGDESLVRELMPLMHKSMLWLEEQDDDGDLFPSGYGIIEIAGLNAEMIDTITYTAQAWGCYADMCRLTGDTANAALADVKAQMTRDALNTQLWDEEAGSYCDAYASPDFVASRKETILGRRKSRTTEAEEEFNAMLARKTGSGDEETGFLINGNWTIACPMETGLATKEQADRALQYLNTSRFVGPWGVYLNALSHDATMTISTGVVAVAQARYGYADRALNLLEKMTATFGMGCMGMIAEMSPDYGCFCQAWTAYALFTPVVRHFFGVQPKATRVELSPAMPEKWTHATLKHVRVLDQELSLEYHRSAEGYVLTVTGSAANKTSLNLSAGEQLMETQSAAEQVIYTVKKA